MGLAGPLLIVVTQVHGNEPAGTLAMQQLFQMIDAECAAKPDFRYQGKIVGLRGNLQASRQQSRFILQDLNRMWLPEQVAQAIAAHPGSVSAENRELFELHHAIQQEIDAWKTDRYVLLDVHTTTATGGIFLIPPPGSTMIPIVETLPAPMVMGLIEVLKGTLVEYAQAHQPWGVAIDGLVFEAGQHQEASSVSHAISAIIGLMRGLKMLAAADVAHKHDALLEAFGKRIPQRTTVFYRHPILPGDQFQMLPGFENFMPIHAGQILAHDRHGPITASQDGYILMPLYQALGSDGFFLLKDV